MSFEPPDMSKLPVDVAHAVHHSDLTIAVYQNAMGEPQAAVMHSPNVPVKIAVHDIL